MPSLVDIKLDSNELPFEVLENVDWIEIFYV